MGSGSASRNRRRVTVRRGESPSVTEGLPAIIERMSFADWLAGRQSHASRLPARIEELRGPVQGTIMLPPHLSFPGLRECDVTDDRTRRSMYGIVLTQGNRNDVARYLNPELLRADWPLIKDALDSKLVGTCERRFALDGRGGGDGPGGQAPEPAEV
jgi:hypothetical protein